MYERVVIPQKSPNDKREYKAVELHNKLKVVMVYDPTIEKSACSISVGVGSLCDPDRSLGLAHFLEHMLFMGSEGFPEHNEYSSFVTNNGGSDNAFTDMDETNYFFEVANDAFPEGVKRLAQFFRKPLLNPQCVEKQRQAVHEEFKLATSDDNSRKWQIIHTLAEGPYSRFSVGNQDTLNHKDILEDLHCFYNKCYSANIINAVLISNLPIQKQEQLLPTLSKIENNNCQKPKFGKPFPKSRLGKLIKVESIKDEYIMEFIWVLDNLKPLYRKHIDEYLVFVLSHESEGSLSAYLESQGYTSQLIAYKHHILEGTIIGIELQLTQPGTTNYKKVYQIVMQYVSLLVPEEFIFNDIRMRNALKWQFLEKIGSSSYSNKIATKMHFLPLEHVLDYKNLTDAFDQQLIGSYLKKLNPENLLLFMSSAQPIKNSVEEPHMGAKYKVEELLKFKTNNVPQFNFLKSNKFMPVVISMQDENFTSPKKIRSNITLLKRNNICKGGLTLNIYSPCDKVFLELYQEWVNMMLKESTYDASMLDSNMQFSNGRGVFLSVFGYDQVVLKLVRIIGEEIHQLIHNKKKSEIFFQIMRERLMQEYENYFLEECDDVASEELDRILNASTEITVEETFKTLGKFTFKKFTEKVSSFWKNVQMEWVAVGNFSEDQIIETATNFEKNTNSTVAAISPESCLKLTEDLVYVVNIPSPEIANSGAVVYFELERNNFRNKIIAELLLIFVKEPFFDDLRTSKQLGYIASSGITVNGGIIGVQFVVVSSTTDSHSLYREIVTFVQSHFSTLKHLSAEKMDQMKSGVLVKQSEPFKNLEQEYDFVMQQIMGRTYEFNRKDKEAIQQQLDGISLIDLENLVQKMLRHHVVVEVVSEAHAKEFLKHSPKAKSLEDIKKTSQFYPDYESPVSYLT